LIKVSLQNKPTIITVQTAATTIERRLFENSYSRFTFTTSERLYFLGPAAGTNPSQQTARQNRSAEPIGTKSRLAFSVRRKLTESISQNAGAQIPRAAQTPFRVVVAQSIVVAFSSLN